MSFKDRLKGKQRQWDLNIPSHARDWLKDVKIGHNHEHIKKIRVAVKDGEDVVKTIDELSDSECVKFANYLLDQMLRASKPKTIPKLKAVPN